jgi:aminoglycoside phosphotransferase (APT) family kinase protein
MDSGTALRVEAVTEWLAEQGVLLAPPVAAKLISGGRSNLTYALTDGDARQVVLRRPPFDMVLATAHDMSREWRFISALWPTPVPVPEPLAVCEGDGPLGVPFYVMGYVEGLILHDAPAAEAVTTDARREATASLVDTLAALHGVDIDAVGLGGAAKREDYVGRQLRRWKRQWDQSNHTDIRAVAVGSDRLTAAVPAQERASIVHGDFRLGNMIVAPTGQIRAVLDWELATLGDPLADFGWLVSSWPESGEWHRASLAGAPPSVLPGFPGRQWLVDRYAARTGFDLSRLDFYVAFNYWRGACISAGVLTRYETGAMGDDGFDYRDLRRSIEERAEAALTALDRGGW